MRRLSSGRIHLQQAHYRSAYQNVNLQLPGPKVKSTIYRLQATLLFP